jgi:hypothetical protein
MPPHYHKVRQLPPQAGLFISDVIWLTVHDDLSAQLADKLLGRPENALSEGVPAHGAGAELHSRQVPGRPWERTTPEHLAGYEEGLPQRFIDTDLEIHVSGVPHAT